MKTKVQMAVIGIGLLSLSLPFNCENPDQDQDDKECPPGYQRFEGSDGDGCNSGRKPHVCLPICDGPSLDSATAELPEECKNLDMSTSEETTSGSETSTDTTTSTTDDPTTTDSETDNTTTSTSSQSSSASESETTGFFCDEDLQCDEDEDIISCLYDCASCTIDNVCDEQTETPYACPEDCPATVCDHDGKVDALTEQCDDGNMNNEDDCTNACELAECGDGIVWTDNGEECDDGNVTDGDGCSSECVVEHRLIFVSSTVFTGNLGGLAGADSQCQILALNAQLKGGPFKAWLSDGLDGPNTRFGIAPEFSGRFELVDGTVVAEGWADLTDGTLSHEINVDEKGNPNVVASVWTGTNSDGIPEGSAHCNSWKSNGTNVSGWVGGTDVKTEGWTKLENGNSLCSNSARLYCFEVK